MNRSVAPLAAILDLNTDLLLNCLDGLTDEEARHRLAGGGNSLAFLIAHLPLPNPLTPLLADARSIDDIRGWPPVDELRWAWRTIGKPAMTYTRTAKV